MRLPILVLLVSSVFLAQFAPGARTGGLVHPHRIVRAQPSDRSVVRGEELLYEVSWWIVKLGTIRLRVVDLAGDGAGARSTVRADIDSYEELPFASLHSVSETVMDTGCWSVSSLAITEDDERWKAIRYRHDAERRRLYVERGTVPGRESRDLSTNSVDSLEVGGSFQDGLSIFYFARAHLFDREGMSVPTIVEGTRGKTVFRYPGERASEEIDAVDYPVDLVRFEGDAQFSGIYGLTGDFEGWFSNDESRVPVLATMGLMVGSVRIELIGWDRDGWTPPRSPED